MLAPEQMDDAGELVAAAYRQVETEMLEYLVAKMIEGDVTGQRAQTAILLLSQTMPLELRKIIDAHAGEIDAAVRRDVERSLRASDAFDLAAISDGLGVSLAADALAVQTLTVAASVRSVLARDNLEMTAAARSKFVQWSTWAATQAGTGAMTPAHALHKAVRELAHGGITMVSYRDPETGEPTVTNKADVAVQRHIRTLIAQGAAQLTMQRVQESGCGFVEVSSHIGARPSHAEWHGRVYHVGGAIDYEGEHYEDFEFGTGYGGACGPYTALGDQLLGVNCRHSFGPWVPGSPRAYSPDPEHPSGLDNDEVYALTQKQRQIERDIRDDKRDVAACRQLYDADPSAENQVELAKAKMRLRDRQAKMRELVKESNAKCKPGTEVLVRQPQREWAGDMPKGKVALPDPSKRTLDEFLAMPSVEKARADAGMTKAELRGKMRDHMGVGKGGRDGFAFYSTAQQRDELEAVLSSTARRAETKVKRSVPVATALETPEGIAVRDSEKLQKAFKPETAAQLGVGVEDALLSGDAARANAARVFARTVEGDARYRRVRNIDTAQYVPARKEIQVPQKFDRPAKTVVHETLHLADRQGTVKHGIGGNLTTSTVQFSSHEFTTGNGYIRARIKDDWAAIEKAAADTGKDVETYLAEKMEVAGLVESYEARAFFSDFVDAASNGGVQLGWAHTYKTPNYWTVRGGENIGTECLANYGGSAVCNPVEYGLIKQMFPLASETLDELLEAMAYGLH